MSIINDALKKLQNQIGQSHTLSDGSQNPQGTTTLTPAQEAGFETVPSLYASTPSTSPKKEKKTAESRLVLILGLLCLLTALFAPIVNKRSVVAVVWTKIKQAQKTSVSDKQPQTSRSNQTSVQRTSQAVNTAPEQQPEAATSKPEPIKQIVRSLTAPLSKASANNSPSRIIINGIMTRGEQNLALIDGQVYEEGDEVDGVKLIKITPKGVTVLEDGVERTVKVMGQ